MADTDLMAVCTECHSDQPDDYMNRNPFFQQGSPTPCKFCGGVTIIAQRGKRNSSIDNANNQRGLPARYRKKKKGKEEDADV